MESLTRQVEDAKRALKELEEIEKLKSLHKLKIRNAIKSRDIQRMEQTLHDVKVDGFGSYRNTSFEILQFVPATSLNT